MAKQGRDLERLVALLERSLATSDFVIRSPERLVGRRSGAAREIDVTIRGSVGSSDVLIAVECRDRGRPATVQWIDEAVAKAADIGASELVLVSSTGFSAAALDYARREGLLAVTVGELESGEGLAWIETRQVTVYRRCVEFERATCHLLDDVDVTPIPGSPPSLDIYAAWLRRKEDGELVSAYDVWIRDIAPRVYDDDRPERRRVTIDAQLPDPGYQTQIRGDWFDLKAVTFVAWIWIEKVEEPAIMFRYSADAGRTVEGFHFRLDDSGRRGLLTLRSAEPIVADLIPAGSVISVAAEPIALPDRGDPPNLGEQA